VSTWSRGLTFLILIRTIHTGADARKVGNTTVLRPIDPWFCALPTPAHYTVVPEHIRSRDALVGGTGPSPTHPRPITTPRLHPLHDRRLSQHSQVPPRRPPILTVKTRRSSKTRRPTPQTRTTSKTPAVHVVHVSHDPLEGNSLYIDSQSSPR
jgi:hypothetical protein